MRFLAAFVFLFLTTLGAFAQPVTTRPGPWLIGCASGGCVMIHQATGEVYRFDYTKANVAQRYDNLRAPNKGALPPYTVSCEVRSETQWCYLIDGRGQLWVQKGINNDQGFQRETNFTYK